MAVIQFKQAGADDGSATATFDSGATAGNAIFAALFFHEETAGASGVPASTPAGWEALLNSPRANSKMWGLLYRKIATGGEKTFTLPFDLAPVPVVGGRWALAYWEESDPAYTGSVRNARFDSTADNPAVSPTIDTAPGDKLIGLHVEVTFDNVLSVGGGWTAIGQGPSSTISRVFVQTRTASATTSTSSAVSDGGFSGSGVVAIIPAGAGTIINGSGIVSGGGDVTGSGSAVTPTVVSGSGAVTGGGDVTGVGTADSATVVSSSGAVTGGGSVTGSGAAVDLSATIITGSGTVTEAGILTGSAIAIAIGSGSITGGGTVAGAGTAFDPDGGSTTPPTGGTGAAVRVPGATNLVFLDASGIQLSEWVMKRGDLLPSLRILITDLADRPIDLTGVTARLMVGMRGHPLTINAQAVIEAPLEGEIAYDFDSGQTDETGDYRLEVELLYPSGRRMTCPAGWHARMLIVEDLG